HQVGREEHRERAVVDRRLEPARRLRALVHGSSSSVRSRMGIQLMIGPGTSSPAARGHGRAARRAIRRSRGRAPERDDRSRAAYSRGKAYIGEIVMTLATKARLDVRPLASALGAEIFGVDLSRRLDEQTVQAL